MARKVLAISVLVHANYLSGWPTARPLKGCKNVRCDNCNCWVYVDEPHLVDQQDAARKLGTHVDVLCPGCWEYATRLPNGLPNRLRKQLPAEKTAIEHLREQLAKQADSQQPGNDESQTEVGQSNICLG